MPAALLMTLLILAAAALYLAMPRARPSISGLALILSVGAGGALVALALPLAGEHLQRAWFALLALVALAGALRMITHPRPVYSALYFILVVVAVAGLLILMQAEFLAFALLIIYAGAILVTYLFVIMLAQQSGGPAPYDQRARGPLVGIVTGFILLAALTTRLARADAWTEVTLLAEPQRAAGTVANVGTHLLTHYIVGVELAGVLLLAALVGAIAIARRRVSAAGEEEVR